MHTYVYVLLNPTKKGVWKFKNIEFNLEPFYVGIGVGKRFKEHFNLNREKYESNFTKFNLIKKLVLSNNKPSVIKIFENLNRESAKKIEIEFIKTFGKLIDGTGILTNITDGGDETVCNSIGRVNPHSKSVYQYSIDGTFIKKWGCLREIGRELGVSYNNIGDNCRGVSKTAYGFQWFYENKGKKIDSVIVREQSKRWNKVYKFNLEGVLVAEYKSLTDAAKANLATKSLILEKIKRKVSLNKNFFSYSSKLDPSFFKASVTLNKILFKDEVFYLTNAEIIKKFNVSKYYLSDVKRGRHKTPIFQIIK